MAHSAYLENVLIILLAAVVVVPLFQRLRSSPVLGYLVAGAAIGPYGLGIIADAEETMLLAHFGVVFLLFTIGLELSVERLRVLGRSIFGLGTAQVLVTGVLAWAAAVGLGLDSATALVLGGGLALSSSAVVLQILVERNELTARHGRIAFAVLLLQDLTVVPLLALVPLLGQPRAGVLAALGLALLKAAGAMLAIIAAGRLILRPVLRTLANGYSPELFTGITLLVVLGVSWLTESAGLSMALGAFLAGLVIAETEFRHQVEGTIEPFRGILLSLFFMTVGMAINLHLIADQALLIAALVTALVVGKAVILIGLSQIFGLPLGLAIQVGLGLAQGSEFALVLFNLAMAQGVLAKAPGELALLVVALSMALTPLLMALGRMAAQRLPPPAAALGERLVEETSDIRGHVLIAGFGRVGQTLARLMEAHGVSYIALDLEARRVAEAHARGVPVYFGDASRAEVLRAAGAGRARAAVVTLDHPKAAERAVRALRQHWPTLPIFVRARDGGERLHLTQAGATVVVPEMVEGSLHLGSTLLRAIGQPPRQIATVLDTFRDEAYARLGDIIPARPDSQGSDARNPGARTYGDGTPLPSAVPDPQSQAAPRTPLESPCRAGRIGVVTPSEKHQRPSRSGRVP